MTAYLAPRTTGPGLKRVTAASTSAGALDADRLVALGDDGKLDPSLMVVDPQLVSAPADAVATGQGYTLDPISFTVEYTHGVIQWQRRLVHARAAGLAVWENIPGATSATLTLSSPDWVDVHSEFRATVVGGPSSPTATVTAPTLVGLDPAAEGAVGDGVADDLAELQATATAALLTGDRGIDLNGRTYRIGGNWFIPNGIRAVFNGTIIPDAGSRVLLDRADDVVAKDVTFGNSGTYGLHCRNNDQVAVVDCLFLNRTGSVASLAFDVLANNGPTSNTLVFGCDFIGPVATSATTFSTLTFAATGVFTAPYTDTKNQWLNLKTLPTGVYPNTDARVLCCGIQGGYYGISCGLLDRFEIAHNTVSDNVRGMSVQNSCFNGHIHHNTVNDPESTGIHLAYGSSDNHIEWNVFTASRMHRTPFQCYVATKRNKFNDNVSYISGTAPQYAMYCAINADDNEFLRNEYNGPLALGGIVIEAAWQPNLDHPPHRGHWAGAGVETFASADSVGNSFQDNAINSESAVEPMCVADVTDSNGLWGVTALTNSGNTYNDKPIAAHTYSSSAAQTLAAVIPSDLFPKSGTTAERPVLAASDIGFRYFDTTLDAPVFWNGSAWRDANGADPDI